MVNREAGRLLWRAAVRIHGLLLTHRNHLPYDLALHSEYQELDAIVSRLQLAQAHGWRKSLLNQAKDYERHCRSLVDHLQHRRQGLRESLSQPPLVPAQEIWRDLLALHHEFPEVTCDLQAGTLNVVTNEIVLEGVDLGSFRIVLEWKRLNDSPPYRVIAAGRDSSSGITHPHVQDQQLCEGEGNVPISNALVQGRLLDFFLLVRQILETYNPDSAYRKLSDWSGRDCQDCGCSVSADDSSHCEACGNEICSDCRYGCEHCDNDCCSQCHAVCAKCLGIFCPKCLETCTTCSREFCESCLETPDCCPSCYDKEHSDDAPTETEEEVPPEAGSITTAVHPVCLGEAPVPA